MTDSQQAGWIRSPLRELIERYFTGPSPTCEEREIASSNEWGLLKTTAITWNGWNDAAHKVPPRQYWGRESIEIAPGDVLITKAGPRHRVGVVVHVDATRPHLMVSGKMVGLRPKTSKVLPSVLAGLLSTEASQAYLDSRTTGMAESQTNFADAALLSVLLDVPPLREQRRIAQILDTVDDQIRATEHVIEKLQLVREGLLWRLIEEAAPIVDTPISILADTYAGGTPSRAFPGFYGGGIPWVKSGEVNRSAISETEETITPAALQASSARWVPPNVPLIAMYGATAGVISWTQIRVTTNQAVLAVVPRAKDVSARWMYWSLVCFSPKLLVAVQGSGQPNLSKGIIDRFSLPVPSLAAQKEAAATLDAHEDLIDVETTLCHKLRLEKYGLMGDLLSGRIRVPLEAAS